MPRPILLTLLIFLPLTTTAQLRPPSDKVLQKFRTIYAVKAADNSLPESAVLKATTEAFSLDDEDVNQAVGLMLEEHKSFRDTAGLRMLVTETIDRFIAGNGLIQHCSPNFQQGRPALQLFTDYMCDCMQQLQQAAGDRGKQVPMGNAFRHCIERFRANDRLKEQFQAAMDTAGIFVKELQTCVGDYVITNCTFYRDKLINMCADVALPIPQIQDPRVE